MAQVGNEPRSSRGDGRLVRRSREVDDRSFRAFLASASVPRVAWATPDGLELVGGGAAATVRADGPDRFESLHADATRLFDDVDATGPPAARPRLVGGFAFDADHRPDSPWEGFPAAQFFLPAIQLTRADDRTWLSVTEYGPDADPETVAERLDERATAMTDLPMMSPSGGRPGVVATQRTTTKAEWTAGVERAVERIRAGELRKVVLATALDADLETDIDLPAMLERFRRTYPECYRFLIQPTAETGFFGPPPERLVRMTDSRVETEALAGSAERGDTPEEDADLAAGLETDAKTVHEQALVAETIADRLEPLGEVAVGERRVAKFANIQHLRTPITADLRGRWPRPRRGRGAPPHSGRRGAPARARLRSHRRDRNLRPRLVRRPDGLVRRHGRRRVRGRDPVGGRRRTARHPLRGQRHRRGFGPRRGVGRTRAEVPARARRTRTMSRDVDSEPGADGNSPRGPPWPNRNTLWGHTVVDELAKAGVAAVCIAPGSRSTPLTVAFADHPDIEVFSHLDERSAAFFALGRAKRTGDPTPVLSTSGTATANFHPAGIEANQARVPLLVLTADRPPELRDSGANQTIDQTKLYGGAVRWYHELPEPDADGRKLRSVRVTVARALAQTIGTPPGPVHLNVPFAKPLEPLSVPEDVPEGFERDEPFAATGRDGPFVKVEAGQPALDDTSLERVADALAVERGLVVAGPSTALDADAVTAFANATGFPVLADPLSGLRFGPHRSALDTPVCGGYDSYLDTTGWPDPEVVVRLGASPTSKVLRHFLRDAGRERGTRQFVVDPASEWREATFVASDLLAADPNRLVRGLAPLVSSTGSTAWRERFARAEREYWDLVDEAHEERFFEGTVLRDTLADAPDPATVFVSNSMTVRDADRFGEPRDADLTVLGNRGASGIDGIVSSALGAGSATDEPLVLVLGDLAYYHDMNGLLALSRCGVDATIVLVNNDGGGIFRMLPIADFEPPFTDQFKTPHGLDFAPTADLYDFEFVRADDRGAFRDAYRASLDSQGTQVIEVAFDSEASHGYRETVHERVRNVLGE